MAACDNQNDTSATTDYNATSNSILLDIEAFINATSQPSCLDEKFNRVSSDSECEYESCKYFISDNNASNCPVNFEEISSNETVICVKIDLLQDSRNNYSPKDCEKIEHKIMQTDNYTVYTVLVHLIRRRAFENRSIASIEWYDNADLHFNVLLLNDFSFECISLNEARQMISFENCSNVPVLCQPQSVLQELACPHPNQYGTLLEPYESNCYEFEFLAVLEDQREKFEAFELFRPTSALNFHVFFEFVRSGLISEEHWCLVDVSDLEIPSIKDNVTTINHKGEIFLNGHYNCVIKVHKNRENPEWSTELFLEFSENNYEFNLIVYNVDYIKRPDNDPNYGIECRMDGYGHSEVLDIEPVEKIYVELTGLTQSFFKIKLSDLETRYPHKFWCEAQTITGRQLRTVDVIGFADTIDAVFTIVLNVVVGPDDTVESILDRAFFNQFQYGIYSIESTGVGNVKRVILHVEAIEDLNEEVHYLVAIQKIYDNMMDLKEHLEGFDNEHINFVSIKSVRYCFLQLIPDALKGKWHNCRTKHTIASDSSCLTDLFLPYTRKCIGDLVLGGEWENSAERSQLCREITEVGSFSVNLFEIEQILLNNTNETSAAFDRLCTVMKEVREDRLISINVIQLGNIFELLALQRRKWLSHPSQSSRFVNMVNTITKASRKVVSQASLLDLNTTNIILDTLDTLLSLPNEYDEKGLHIKRTSNLIVFDVLPSISNITGLALFFNSEDVNLPRDDLSNYQIENLYMNQSLVDLMRKNEFLEVATFVPEKLYRYLVRRNKLPSLRIIITIFLNDILFQTQRISRTDKIISVSIPDCERYFPYLLPTVYKSRLSRFSSSFCGFYDFNPPNATMNLGEWNHRGCSLMHVHPPHELIACGCSHLTHFTFLLMGQHLMYDDDYDQTPMRHNTVLQWITRVCSGLSLIGIALVVLTATMFHRWRSDIKNLIILQFSLAIGIQIILLVIADSTVKTPKSRAACVLLGCSIQYIILVTFSWMLVLALRQYYRFVKVFNSEVSSHFCIIAVTIGWGVPLIPTIISASVAPHLYLPTSNEICYPKDYALIFGLVVPIAIVVTINLTIFVIVICYIFQNVNIRKTVPKFEIDQLRVAIILFFLLGLTWMFGFISMFRSSMQITFSYIFNLTAPLQGFIVFIYSIILNPETRRMWLIKLRLTNYNKFTNS